MCCVCYCKGFCVVDAILEQRKGMVLGSIGAET